MLYTAAQTTDLLTRPLRYLLVEQTGHVLTLTLNRPEKKNALNPTLLAELAFAIAYAHVEADVWVVVLAAAGDTFCAGMDLKALSNGTAEPDTVPPPSGPVRLAELMAGLHKPCIARVQGPVYAGGFLLAGTATYAVVAEGATFALPEVKRGLFPFQVLAVLLDIMPARQALDLCLRGRTLSAADALAAGLATQVVPLAKIDQTVAALVTDLIAVSPMALQFGLRAFQQLKTLPSDQQQAFLHDQFTQIQQTADAREGMAAFLEKRSPTWQNR
ncbi:enoyl-CoA hydratase-related protein [Fibrella aquatilis]|uniref:Enoyl-CoA hydratase/isomerase family protein n=1 Tax=Fibrella aquatilis TaxID=2817059 RepID=A0A939GB56_9BACT|nr:enoyl-CoA hydratase-related protein [Fibrella aquatilis]MBO0933407.1 enoyl-CoA hydratase/isomerase family protein [Fibrella aquatilis]